MIEGDSNDAAEQTSTSFDHLRAHHFVERGGILSLYGLPQWGCCKLPPRPGQDVLLLPQGGRR
jgi:hypothetical protein